MASRTVFVSDVHLRATGSPGTDDIADRFFAFLEEQCAAATATVYVLGDLFDYWFESRGRIPPSLAAHCDALRRVTEAGTRLCCLSGNRDFLLGTAFVERTGARVLGTECEVDLGGVRVRLLHGDLLMPGIKRYRQWHRLSRGLTFRRLARWLPPSVCELAARAIRKGSEREKRVVHQRARTVSSRQLESRYAAGADVVIAGHFHEARDEVVRAGAAAGRLIVLGCWDAGRGAYAVWDGSTLTLER
jgi:UDP-2,3-diacylglucosamine hydrolase